MRPEIITTTLVSLLALDGRNEGALLALAAAATDGLEAHLAAAIRDSARERNVEPCADQRVLVASPARLRELGIPTSRFGDWPERLGRQGQEILFVTIDGRMAGLLGIAVSAGVDEGNADVIE